MPEPEISTPPAAPPAQSRWFPRVRFSLRTLVLGVLLIGSSGGLWWKWAPWGTVEIPQTSPITRAAFSPDTNFVVVGNEDHSAQVFTLSGQKVFQITGHAERISALNWSPSGEVIATGSPDGIVRLWNAHDGQLRTEIKVDAQKISEAVFSDDSRSIAIGTESGFAGIWDVGTGSQRVKLLGHDDAINQIAFSRDGRRVATAGNDGFVAVFDAQSGAELNLIELTCPGFSSDLEDKKARRNKYRTPADCVTFSNSGTQLASADNYGFLRVWDLSKKNPTEPVAERKGGAFGLLFSKDDSDVFSAGCLESWDFKHDRLRQNRTLPDTPHLAYRPKGYDIHGVAVSKGMRWEALFHRHILYWNKSSPLILRYFNHPDCWYGVAWLPEFWLTLLCAGGLIWSVWRDRRTL